MSLYLSAESLDWALKHVENCGDTDIFPVPFEFEAIRHTWDSRLRRVLAGQDLHQYRARPYRRCLSPKHRFGFRVSTQLDPFDMLVYTALTCDLGTDIEQRRIPVKKQIVHSYRFKPDSAGRFFDPAVGYDTFIQQSAQLASSDKYHTVVVADIADFFPRIYFHPLENTLDACTQKHDHAKALKSLIKQWNFTVSYGIPVGQAASRLLAELVISDVDEALISEQKAYCRFSDDFRIFCRDSRDAHESLAFLANVLFENHGLTLQQHKTRILSVPEFRSGYLETGSSKERTSLTDRFRDILDNLGIDDWYEEICYDDLDSDVQEEIDRLNLGGILKEQIGRGSDLDLNITRFVLRRLAQINDVSALEMVGEHIEVLYPVFTDVLAYITSIRNVDKEYRHKLGKYLIDLVSESVVGHLPFHRCWIINTFTKGREWDNQSEFAALYNTHSDEFCRRELILALGRAVQAHWFKTRKRDVLQLGPWERRAFLAAASCLPGDEPKHWYNSIYKQVDDLEKAVVDWARDHPFRV
jgi:hypothetical protein